MSSSVTPFSGSGIRAAPGVYDKWKKTPTGGGGTAAPGSAAPGGVPALPPFPGAGSGSGGGGAAGGGVPVSDAGPSLVLPNTVAPDPYLEEQVRNLRARMGADTTERAIGRSTTGILDAAALGAADAGAANLSSRGLVGSGAGQAFLQKRFFDPAQRAAAGAATDIALRREQDLDRLVLGGTSIMGAPGQSSLASRSLGLQQWQAQTGAGQAAQGLSLEQQRLNQQQQQSQIENWLRMYALSQQGGY